MNRLKTLVWILLVAGAAACGSDTSLDLRDGPDDEWSERRHRMDVRVRARNSATPSEPWGDWYDIPQVNTAHKDFRDVVGSYCDELVRASSDNFAAGTGTGCYHSDHVYNAPDTCAEEICRVELATCMALFYLELSRAVDSVEIDTGPIDYQIAQQAAETNVGFDEQALAHAQLAITAAGQALRAASGDTTASSSYCTAANMSEVIAINADPYSIRVDLELATAMVEATDLAERAGRQLAQDTAGVADSDFSAAPDRGHGAREAWVAPVLSRFHAAQLITGGDGLPFRGPGDPTGSSSVASQGVLPHGPCEGTSCERALGLLRDSGISPSLWISTDPFGGVSIENLIEGTGQAAAGGGIAARLAERYGDPSIASLGTAAFLDRFGIVRSDIVQAREHYSDQVAIYDRNLALVAPSPVLATPDPATPSTSSFTYYQASVTPATSPDPMHYIASLRFEDWPDDDRPAGGASPIQDSAYPTPDYANRSLANTLDYAQSVAREVVNLETLAEPVLDAMGVLVSQSLLSGTRRVESCYRHYLAGHEVRVRVYGATDAANLAIVNGTSGLQCATTGLVEGQPCDLDDWLVTSTKTAATSSHERQGFDKYVELMVVLPVPGPFRGYVVERRPGTADGSAGRWDAIGSFGRANYAPTQEEHWIECHQEAFDPVTTTLVNGLTKTDSATTLPVADCFGSFRGPLPLEEELIEDGDALETSWRHHLAFARDAADRADSLGEELVRAGLSMDMRAEAAVDELEDQCGVRPNLDILFRSGASVAEADLSGLTSPPPCDFPYVDVGNRCVFDLRAGTGLDIYDLRVLGECLGEDEIVPVVGLGSDSLCVSYRGSSTTTNPDDDVRNVLCDGTGGAECPRVVGPDDSCAAGELRIPRTDEMVANPDGELLMLFGRDSDTGSDGAPAAIQPLACGALRQARYLSAGAQREAVVNEILDSHFFSYANVSAWAQRIGWHGLPRDYSYLTVDGSRWYGTGQPFQEWASETMPAGPSPYWPCQAGVFLPGEAPSCSGGVYGASLFCSAYDCSNDLTRYVANERLARAALFLSIFSGNGTGTILTPLQVPGTDSFEPGLMSGVSTLTDENGVGWIVGRSADYHYGTLSGIFAIPADGLPQTAWHGYPSSYTNPMTFVALDTRQDGAERVAEHLWRYMGTSAAMYAEPQACVSTGQRDVLREALRDPNIPESTIMLEGRPRWCWDTRRGLDVDPLTIYFTMADGNEVPIASEGFTRGNILDALELMCEAARRSPGAIEPDPSSPPRIESAADIPMLRGYLNGIANGLEAQGETIVIQNVPMRAVRAIRGDADAIVPDEGQYGQAVVGLRQSLRAMSELPRAIAAEIRGFSSDLELLELALANVRAEREIANLEMISGMLSQVAACLTAAGGAATNQVGAVATCANSAAQIGIQFRLNEIELSMLENRDQELIIQFNERYLTRQDALASLGEQILQRADDVNRNLSTIQSSRRVASRALARAFFADSDTAGHHYAVSTVQRRQYNTLRERYLRSFRSAVQLADLARRAIEQRLAVDMAELTAPMTLVDTPSKWAGSVCTLSPIDYAEIRSIDDLPGDTYAGSYVGDYVRDLERFVESYRVDFPSTTGNDVAVISLRDDIMSARADCPVEVPNLLAASNWLDLERSPCPDGGLESGCWSGDAPEAWTVEGCLPEDPALTTSCVALAPVEGAGLTGARADEPPAVYKVVFAPGSNGTGTPPTTYANTANLGQTVAVRAGLHRVSWYGSRLSTVPDLDPANAVQVVSLEGGTHPSSAPLVVETIGTAWTHYVRYFELPAGLARVQVVPVATTYPTHQAVLLAGVQLEFAGDRVFESANLVTSSDLDPMTGNRDAYAPRPFAATTAASMAVRPACGGGASGFRSQWTYHCEDLTATGFTPSSGAPAHCFWEATFSISQERIERLEELAGAHVALGSFNYRIDAVAANFVGTAIRDCSASATPETCYASGFVPFSIEHRPPYEVRDFWGGTYDAPLVLGRIEQGRGLAAERYISNPISSADQSLLSSYWRQELRGRPLAGNFAIRIWDVPGIDFTAIEDVQLALRYRYFTRTPAP